MTTIHHACDRCGNAIDSGLSTLDARCGPLRDRMPTVDLCRHCAGAFAEFLRPGRDATDAPQNRRDPAKQPA